MRQTFSSKIFRTISSVVLLTTLIGPNIQQTAQAQMDISVPADIDDEACIASGVNSFYLLRNIDLSYEQIEQIFALTTLKLDAYNKLIASYPAEDDLSGGYSFVVRPGAYLMPGFDKGYEEAMDAATKTITSGEAMIGQIAALNEQYGQYGEFSAGKKIILTPEQKAEIKQLDEDFDARYVAVMTNEQQQQYQENLATEKRINEACGIVKYEVTQDDIYFTPEPTTF